MVTRIIQINYRVVSFQSIYGSCKSLANRIGRIVYWLNG